MDLCYPPNGQSSNFHIEETPCRRCVLERISIRRMAGIVVSKKDFYCTPRNLLSLVPSLRSPRVMAPLISASVHAPMPFSLRDVMLRDLPPKIIPSPVPCADRR